MILHPHYGSHHVLAGCMHWSSSVKTIKYWGYASKLGRVGENSKKSAGYFFVYHRGHGAWSPRTQSLGVLCVSTLCALWLKPKNRGTIEQGTEECRKLRGKGVKQMNRRTIEQGTEEGRMLRALRFKPLALCFSIPLSLLRRQLSLAGEQILLDSMLCANSVYSRSLR